MTLVDLVKSRWAPANSTLLTLSAVGLPALVDHWPGGAPFDLFILPAYLGATAVAAAAGGRSQGLLAAGLGLLSGVSARLGPLPIESRLIPPALAACLFAFMLAAVVALMRARLTIERSDFGTNLRGQDDALASRLALERTLADVQISEERLRLALRASGDRFWDCDLASGRTVFSERRKASRLPVLDELAESMDQWMERLHPDDAERVQVAFHDHCSGLTPRFREDYRLRCSNGSYRWVADRGEVVERDPAGRALRVVGVQTDITARKWLEEERQMFVALADSSVEFVGMCDRDFNPFYVNPAGVALVGLADLETALQVKVQDFFFPEDQDFITREFFPQVMKQGHAEVEIRFRRFDNGKPVWMLYNVFNIMGSEGEVMGWATVSRNIHDRKLAEQALAESQAVLAATIDSAMDAIITVDADQRVQYFNAAAERIFGCEASAAIGQSLQQFIPPELRARHSGHVAQLSGEELSQRFMAGADGLRGRRADGSEFPMEASVSRIGIGASQLFTVILRDITERKAAEQALKEREDDLNRAQAVGQIGSWRLDVRRNVLTWSRENHRIFGIPEGTPMSYETFLAVVHPDDRAYVDQNWRAALNGQPYDIEHRLLVAGSLKWVRERAELEFDEHGVLLGGFGTTQDITLKKAVEASLLEAHRRKDEFVAMLAHELRNPLVPISNAVELLRQQPNDKPLMDWVGNLLDRNVQHMVRLVDDLLDVSRITRGKITLQRELHDIRVILNRAIEQARPHIDGKGHRLRLSLPAEPIYLIGDLVRLAQVFANILNNAAKYTDSGGDIAIEAEADEQSVVVRIRDDGMGIAPDLLPEVFDMFRQDERALDRSQGGLGIGLTLVKALVELHGGEVTVCSPGRNLGSTFAVKLPRVFEKSPSANPVHPTPLPQPVTDRYPPLLLVEDNDDVAESMSVLLHMRGYRVQVVKTGAEALAYVDGFDPPVVMLDIGLPGMDGYELARNLRKLPGGADKLLIALSGYGRKESGRQAALAGIDAYFVKPADIDELSGLIQSFLNVRLQPQACVDEAEPTRPAPAESGG